MSFTDDPNDISARKDFNYQRNLRYESLGNPLRELFQNKEKYRKQSTLKAYLKSKYVSQLTGQGLAQEIGTTFKSESLWKRLKNRIARLFSFSSKFSKEEKSR
ncbi:hypothetical protein [Bacteroidetes bacterium endosymbiont of Geopemphigus sp.]|uniref:hypothetical protein n=1 Tax=Bacteroidetes bacterium endosymbiont of Geopemphigus sp. TaxID=2047937 RepID=UPI000CD0E264|nr:hypothetical protein [Bacteroidetes bacterium endosymbiont of Geopemphigus sp.]